MGQFRVEVTAVGGHGCEREKKDGERVYGCGSMNCVDCLTAKFLADLTRTSCSIEKATLTHWPGTPTEVVDEFATQGLHSSQRASRVRRGSF